MTVWASVRAAVASTTDAFGRFLLANIAWLATVVAVSLAGSVFRPAYLLALAVVPVSCGLLGMAAHAVRKDYPNLRHFREGARRRWAAHLGLGAGMALLVGAAILNVGVGMQGTSLLSALVTVVAAYVAVLTAVVGVAAWPLLLDPDRRRMRLPSLLLLAGGVVVTRPLRLLVVALLEIVVAVGIAQTIILALFLPSFGALLAAHFVLPAADDLARRGRRTRPRRSVRPRD